RYGVRRALEDRYKVLEAESAAAARRVLAAQRPDLLLLDIEMPEESGLDFLRDLKTKDASPAVIMITAYGSEKIAVEAMKSGAYDYLHQPQYVHLERLVQVIVITALQRGGGDHKRRLQLHAQALRRRHN